VSAHDGLKDPERRSRQQPPEAQPEQRVCGATFDEENLCSHRHSCTNEELHAGFHQCRCGQKWDGFPADPPASARSGRGGRG